MAAQVVRGGRRTVGETWGEALRGVANEALEGFVYPLLVAAPFVALLYLMLLLAL